MNVPIVPDDKDWTWVLQRECPECGFDASSLPPESVARLLRANADSWAGVLRGRQPSSDAVPPRTGGRRWSTPSTCVTCACCTTSASG
jgi:hypothetical protein